MYKAYLRQVLVKVTHVIARPVRALRGREWPAHPIDQIYRIETSRRLSRFEVSTGSKVDKFNIGYVGVQPSILRHCLMQIPRTDSIFIDLGCGKGRALAVATEFKFLAIVGIEISNLIASIARRNAATLRRLHPERVPITVTEGDATKPDLPASGSIILFCYNSFRRPLVETLIKNLEKHCALHLNCKLWFIYYNPVHHRSFDESPLFERYFARKIDFAPDEAAVTPTGNTYDSVIIYQSRTGDRVSALPGATADVIITIPDLGADVQMP